MCHYLCVETFLVTDFTMQKPKRRKRKPSGRIGGFHRGEEREEKPSCDQHLTAFVLDTFRVRESHPMKAFQKPLHVEKCLGRESVPVNTVVIFTALIQPHEFKCGSADRYVSQLQGHHCAVNIRYISREVKHLPAVKPGQHVQNPAVK